MRDYLIERVRASAGPIAARNAVREVLQEEVLGGLQHAGAFVPLAFQGGTALRFLYSLSGSAADCGELARYPAGAPRHRRLGPGDGRHQLLTREPVLHLLG